MRVTTGQLRRIVLNPDKFVDDANVRGDEPRSFRNSQRDWMEASWKVYFKSGRLESALWGCFHRAVANGNQNSRRAALAAGATPMLEHFLILDERELDEPLICCPRLTDRAWSGHTLSVKRDLIYAASGGYRVRLLWTDQDLRVAHPDAGLMAAAALAHCEAELGLGLVRSVEVWQLRHRRERTWGRTEIESEFPRLLQRLNDVEEALRPS